MEIYGKEYGFKLTVGAGCEIAELCPGGELKNVRSIITGGGSHSETIQQRTELILSLSRGWAEARKFETGEDAPVLTAELLQSLSPAAFGDVFSAAVEAFLRGWAFRWRSTSQKKTGTASAPTLPTESLVVSVLRANDAHGEAGDFDDKIRRDAGSDLLPCHL